MLRLDEAGMSTARKWSNSVTFALLLVLAVIPVMCKALSCLPCHKVKCDPLPNCPGGTVPSVCGCCQVCAKQLNEKCDGPFGIHGKCDKGLECTTSVTVPHPRGFLRPVRVMRIRKSTGVCKAKGEFCFKHKDFKIRKKEFVWFNYSL